MIHIDTHIAIWLYEGLLEKFSNKAKSLLEKEQILISPMAILELELLHEINRYNVPSSILIEELQNSIDLEISDANHNMVITNAKRHKWTRDPFDRIIVANASVDDAFLLTKDKEIHKMFDKAIW